MRSVRKLVCLAAVTCALLALPAAAEAHSVTGLCATATTSPAPCSSGWYAAPVTLSWTWDPGATSALCATETFSSETTGLTRSCSVDWADGTTTSTVRIRIDTTPPTVSGAAPDRPPDRNGWYTHPVTFTFSGADALSGIASCSTVVYSGPDDVSAPVTGGCTDSAGNTAVRSIAIKYKATPPVLSNVRAAAGEHAVSIHWVASPDTAFVEVLRSRDARRSASLIYRGTGQRFRDHGLSNGVNYRYRVIAQDAAGNRSETDISATPGVPVLTLGRPSRTVGSAPLLSWRRVAGANYYNVQLFHNGQKILSAWPRGTRLELSGTWVYRGRRRRLARGAYSWYVWPGFGPRSSARYGSLLGRGSFTVG